MSKKLICMSIVSIMIASLLYGCSSLPTINESSSENESKDTQQIQESVAKLSAEYTTIEMNTTEKEDGSYLHTAKLDGKEIKEYDYTWHVDPAGTYEETDDAPAEYYTGTKPEGDSVYIAHDIYYYPLIDESKFEKVQYDGETEWVTYYQSEEYKDFIFGTLPVKGSSVPTEMMHSAEDAYDNAVLHIDRAGTYKLTGDWHGQIYIDLGDHANEDPDAVVTLILDNANIDCSVAPGVIFKKVYECDGDWEDRDDYDATVDTYDAGANIIIADASSNKISGTNIFRMLKTKLKDDDSMDAVPVQKKMRKNDGALYSYMSMNIYGENNNSGTLDVTSGNEGINSELHLTINGANINIYSQDDGINTNEDGVSVTTINGGDIRIVAGLGSEGDGIDSNGYIMINGGKLISLASPMADAGLDSSCGTYIRGGEVLALGSTMDWAENNDSDNSLAVTMNLQFINNQDANKAIEIMDADGNLVFSYNQSDDPRVSAYQRSFAGAIISCDAFKIGSTYSVWIGGKQQAYSGTTMGGFESGRPPQFKDGETPQGFNGKQPPEGFDGKQPPEGFDGKEPPEGFDGKEPPQGFDGKQPPEGFDGKEPPQGFDGKQPPEGFDGKEPSEGFDGKEPPQGAPGMQPPTQDSETTDDISLNPDFVMETNVNNFGRVQDY